MAEIDDVKVCSPVPWFPVLSSQRGNPSPQKEVFKDLTVYRPRFFYFPSILKNYDARLYAMGLQKWMSELADRWRPDLLDAHFVWPDGVAIALLAKRIGIPYVITLRGKIYECIKVPSQRRQCSEALKGAAAVISVSGPMAEEASRLGVADERIRVIPNGVDKKLLHVRDKKECRRRLGLPQGDRILVTVAHLGHRKGHHEVIQALKGLPEDVKLVIVGGAAQGGTPEILEEAASKGGVRDRLILPGRQKYEDIPLYFSAGDASVLASYREGCPNAVLESLACGTPVVASDVGAVRDILPEPNAGRIVPPRQVEPLRQAILEVVNRSWDPEAVLETSGVMSWNRVAREVQAVFKTII